MIPACKHTNHVLFVCVYRGMVKLLKEFDVNVNVIGGPDQLPAICIAAREGTEMHLFTIIGLTVSC